jgi:TBC1 domain family member 20
VYLFAAVIRSRREELLGLDPHDQDMLHFQLSKLPHLLKVEELIVDALSLLKAYPPHTLGRPWRAIPRASVLRTALSAELVAAQSLDEGQAWLEKQSAEARRQAALEKRLMNLQRTWRRVRRPATYVGGALFVAVLAALVARNGDKSVPATVVRNVMFGVWRTLGGR